LWGGGSGDGGGTDAGRDARKYLTGRGITRETADRFGLGFAPRDADAVRSYLTGLGYEETRLLEAGLLVRREETGEVRARFRGRLIFPILDARGRHVGFGGRVIGEGEPKYLNSAESRVFDKSGLLYGLSWARHAIRRDDRVLLVEGYFDAIRVAAAGVESVVAPLGTAFTEGQAKLLARLTKNAFLVYDSDSAGLKATFRAADILLAHGFSVQVVTLPDGEDPDTFVAKHGAEGLLKHVGASIDAFERKIQILDRAGWFTDLRRKRRALDRLLSTIRATADALTRDMYITRTAEVAGVSKELLMSEAAAIRPERYRDAGPGLTVPGAQQPPAGHARGDRRTMSVQIRAAERGSAGERMLLHVMLHHPAQIKSLEDRLGVDDLQDPTHRELFEALLAEGAEMTVERLTERLSSEGAALVRHLREDPEAVTDVDVHRIVADSLAALHVRGIVVRLAEIDRLLPLAPDDAKDAMIAEKVTLRDDIKALGARGFPHYGKARS
ncbi:MAG: toprim domain-containing protein, partial [Gemmatimonadota bacterium]|nr:toprim domain-containing protein [Gemmatimonadota bacterium]